MPIASLVHWWQSTPTTELIWIAIGFAAQLLFSMRFIVQWIASEKARASIVPETFWYFSFLRRALAARLCLLSRGPRVHPRPGAGLAIYSRNIYFIWLGKREPSAAKAA